MAQDNAWWKNDAPVEQSSGTDWLKADKPVEEDAPARGFKGWAQDIGATALKGAIGVPEALVGLADIPTGGRVGKFLENEGGAVGFRPKQAKEIVNDWHSDATKQAQQKFQEAEGLGGKLQAAIENPSVIATSIGESLPSMAAGGVAARGLMAATRLGQMGAGGAALAGAAGEGLTMAGSAAEQIRQETEDGLLTPGQAGLAAATGVVGGALGAVGGKVAQRLGIGDVDTMVAQGARGLDAPAAQTTLKSIPKQVMQGAMAEGLLEELPQSVAEQVLQNLALGKDWSEGVDAAAVLGVLSGGAMGGGAAGFKGIMDSRKAPEQAPAQPPAQPPADQPQALGASLTGTNPADLMSRGTDPLAGQIADARIQTENAAVTRNEFADRNSEALAGGGLFGSRADPLANMIADRRTGEANTAANIQRAAEKRPPMPATAAANILVASREQGLDFTVAPHPDGGYLVVPRAWVTPQVAQQAEASLRETLGRVAQVEDAPLQRAARVSTDPAALDLNTDAVTGYVDSLRTVNTPAAKAFVGEFDAGRITRQDVEQRMAADRGKTPDERLAEAAAQARAPQDPYSLPIQRPSQAMGLNSAAGPMSSAAVIAVDGGAYSSVRATPTATPGEPANGTQTPQAVQAAPQGQAAQPAPANLKPPRGILAKKAEADAARAARNPNGQTIQPAAEAATDAGAVAPPAVRSAGVSGVDEQGAVPALSNVQNTPSSTAGIQPASPVADQPQQQSTLSNVQDQPQGSNVGGAAAKPVSREQAIRDAWRKEPRTIGKWTPISVEAEGQKADMLVNQKRAGGDKDGALHVVNIRIGKMLKDMAREPIAYTFRLTADNRLVEEGIPTVATPGQIAAWKGAGFTLDDKPANVQNAPQAANDGQAKASPVEARAPEGGNAAAAGGVPDAGAGAGVRADGVSGSLDPKTARSLQEAHKAIGYGVTRNQVEGMIARVEKEVRTGKTRNGGVEVSLKDSAILQRRAQLARLQADLALFDGAADVSKNPQELNTSAEPVQKTSKNEQVAQADGVKAAVIAEAAHQAATSPKNDLPQPTEAQKEAGNYQKGHARISGHDITIENPAGSKRRPEWPALKNHYGYFKGSVGADKDHVDVFMTDRAGDESLPVFVVDQVNKDGSFDEHKVIMGASDEAEARATYLQNYEKGWTGLAAITQMSQDDFKAWVRDPAKTKKPVALKRGVLAKMADQKRAAAIDRIAKGTAYFGTKDKAAEFIEKSGIGDTHEVVQAKAGRFEVRAKEAVAPATAPEPQARPAPSADDPLFEQKNQLRQLQNTIDAGVDPQGGPMRADRRAGYEKSIKDLQAEIAQAGKPAAAPALTMREKADQANQQRFDETLKKLEKTTAESLKPKAAPTEAKPVPLTEKEKAAKAKMLGAAAKLADLLSKNTRANITPEQEQKMLPIVIELFEGAMDLGYVKFKQAARYVREFIAGAIDQDAADSIPIDTLQGAYIATARRHADKDITPKKDVITVETIADLEEPAESADTGAPKDGNAAQQLDRTGTGALGGAPAQDVRAPDGGRDAGTGADRGGRSDGAGNPRADDAGRDAGGSLGGDAGAVPVPGRGTRAGTADAKEPRVPRARRAEPGDGLFGATGGLTPEVGANPAPNAPPIPAPQPAAQDFTITDELSLGEGGQKTKFKNNVAAIRLVRDLESTGRMATPEEQAVLAKYVGWGGLPQAFDPNNADWAREYAELTDLMSPEDLADARKSTRYAHYTSREIIVDGIYAALRRFGFAGGKTLEAGAGVGNFIGLMPADMRSAGRFTAIEREPFSSAIARNLYPQQSVQRADFTEFKGTDAYYDAAVGNPPFASDPQTDRSGRKHLSGLSLHNYFFAKSIDMLREGGIMAQVVTNSFLDAKGDRARKYISDRAEFLGAIRLPNNAFSKNAGTEVTTDIIFLKKRPDSEVGGKAARADAKRWLDIGSYTDKNGKQVALNQYFIDNPEMMLGEFGAFGTMYGPEKPALVARQGQDTMALLKAAVERLPAGVYKSIAETGTANQINAAVVALKNPSVKEGGYFLDGDKLMQRIEDIAGEARGVEITPATQWTAKTVLGDAGFDRIKQLASMRATVRGLLAAEMADDTSAMETLRATLNQQYDAYRDAHGLINDLGTIRVFDDDPDFPLLASLEHGYTPGISVVVAKRMGVKPTKSTAKKGPIFTQRVVAARQAVQKVETPADALAVSMAERGKLDAAYIGQLLGMDPEAVLKELSTGDKPLLFLDPATDEYVLRDAYLSGNVRAKLAQAREAGMFQNVAELEAVQPEDVGSHEITARLGSPWVPTDIYRDFAKHLYGEDSRAVVVYLPANSSYQVFVSNGSEVAMTNTWGTRDYPGDALLQAIMNNRSVKVTYRDSEGKTHTDIKATEEANEKAQQVKEKFNDWLFSDPERSEILTKAYNETNNNYVTRVYDGWHMTFPGKVPDSVIKFRRHQRNAIARIVQDRTALLDHVVGAGKTFTVISGAMELKRTGLARKPMVAVPNHLVKQWAADFYRLYPGANVLTATKKDFETSNRRKFLAKIATGDWDAVVIAHSSFGFIKPAPEFEADFNGREIQKIMATIKNVEDSDGEKQVKKRTVKQLEGMKERLENRIRQLRDKPMDDLLDFEQIGVDQLFVDEAHLFKNLMYTTKMQGVAGLNDPTGSQRAYDMYVKTNQVMEKNGRGQGVVFATGTPVSNSLAEMYHMMRYLMPNQMRELGFDSFDAWANTYASVEQVWMQAPSGDGFKAQNRMSNFVNTPELLKMFDQVSDTVTMDDIKKAYAEENDGAEFPLPKLKGGRRTPVSLIKSPAQDAYMAEIAKRAQAIEKRKGPPQKGDDNILVIMSDARKAAMDIRLVDPEATTREKGGRIDRSTDEVVARYKKYDSVKGAQIVFSDLGTPIKHAKKELAEYEALQARIQSATEDVAASAALGNEAAMETLEDAEAAQAELDAMGPDWLSAVKAALRGFSIYDDFKAALIEKGIPEAEIAFIHDYNTDDQKASLFRKVNAGQIRVLLGSTAKLGAGTNVQERLVAEHHLDVPWRPSDVEQREGRIERQGNRLMTEWPDFEIEILAYVTQDTLDMRMWQVQETKLKMINQLRTRKIGREIDNAFEDMELSAGEMQAAATGDINLLKEIQLRNDVKKLEQRRRAFDGQRNDLISRKRRNAEALRELPAKVAEAKAEAEHVSKYRTDVVQNRPAFKMNIDGKDYTDAAEAQGVLRALDEAAEEVTDLAGEVKSKKKPLSVTIDGELIKNRATMAELYSNAAGDKDPIAWSYNGETYRRRTTLASAIRAKVQDAIADDSLQLVGTIGAYSVAVEGNGNNLLEVTLSRDGDVKMSNTLNITDTGKAADRVVTQAENLMVSALTEAGWLERSLERAKKDAEDLAKVDIGGDWPDQAKLDAARAAHKEVLAQLKKKEEVQELPVATRETALILSAKEFKAEFGMSPRFTTGFSVVTPGGFAFKDQPDGTFPTREAALEWIDSQQADEANFGTRQRGEGSPADRAVMSMAGEGKSADEILRFIANASKSPFNRQVARLLRRTKANPAVSLGGDMGGGAGFRFLAKYSRKNHEVTLSGGAADRAEQIFLHETVHAATLLALDRGGEHADRMKALYESVKKQGLSDAYGMKNVGEFVAEAFTNKEFQKALKGYKAPGGTAWDRFVAAVRRILGMSDKSQDALSAALELGVEVMRENIPLRKARSFSAEDGPAFAGVDQTETPEFKRWFGNSAVVDSAGKPLVGRALAVAMYQRGASSATVAKALGDVSVATVKRWVSDAGVQRSASEARGGTKENRADAVRLYGEGLGAFEIANRLGVSNRGVYNWLRDAGVEIRSMSEAQALRAAQGRQPIRGVRSTVSTKWGDVRTDSVYEAARLRQLESDPDVESAARATESIKWGDNQRYTPDFLVKMNDGRVRVEEVKPTFQQDRDDVVAKAEAAREALGDDVDYKMVVTEDLASGFIALKDMQGLSFASDTDRGRFKRALATAKSATGNNGNFDPEDADIAHFGIADAASLKQSALDQIHQTLSHPGKVSVWDKTVGTMRNLAERSKEFKPVFEAAQRFIDDVSMLANEAADVAPRLLPRVESWRDLAKKPVSAEDNKAISKPLFEGTLMWGRDTDGKPVLVDDMAKKYADLSAEKKAKMLMAAGRLDDRVLRMWQGLPEEQFDTLVNSRFESQMLKAGVVWTDAELKSLFALNAQQISLYREARKAIDRSIDLTARADMLRALGTGYAGMRDAVLELPTLADARDLLVETLHADALDDAEQADRLTALINTIADRFEKATGLMKDGYAPLSRFGRYTVDVVDAAGARQYFGMAETMRDANQMAARMRSEFPSATVTQGTMSAEAYKLFAGITPESLELFGNMLGLDAEGGDARDKAFQEYLKLSKNNHSALKRLMHRKGIAGYSEDVGRVLASFVYSNARQAAGGLNAGTIEEAVNAIPKDQGELKDVAMGLRDYVRDPQEEGQAIRGMLFAQYLGGSLASAFVNMTQPVAVTLPWLSQFGGMKVAGQHLAKAFKDMAGKNTYEADLKTALDRAEEDGVVSPQEIHQLMAQARGAGGLRSGDGTRSGDARAAVSNAWERTKVAWGQPFALAEQFNRRSTFIAAYRLAKERGMQRPDEFARRAVLETQFLYSKANKPKWARGVIGGTLFTFKTYSVSYLELLNRMATAGKPGSPERAAGRRAVAWSMVMLMLMGGAGGLPFMEDLEDLIDGIAQMLGYNVSSKQWRRQAMEDVVGKEMAQFMDSGLSGLPGAPIDVSGRLGMGDLLPGTGLFMNKQNRERDLLEIAGPAGDLVARGFTGARKALTGDIGGAALELSPGAVRNAVKGIDMATSGQYSDAKGYKVLDTTLPEAAAKLIGFQPRSVAKVQEANSFMLRSKSFYVQQSGEIKAQWARALYEKDEGALQDVRDRLSNWNRRNPDQPIIVKMPDIWKRVREMGKDRTERIADTAPKALRQQMREAAQ